jgi:hypothetical protein
VLSGHCRHYDTRWLKGFWSTQARVESIVLKATWHWDSNSSVVSDHLGELGFTSLYVDLRSV